MKIACGSVKKELNDVDFVFLQIKEKDGNDTDKLRS